MLGKLRSAFETLRERWLVARVPPNRAVFESLQALADTRERRGVAAYLRERPARSRIEARGGWSTDAATGEARLAYSSSLFADGCLRIRPGKGRGTLAFLPGNQMGADDVMRTGAHAASMTGVADALGFSLACWDWPLQGARRDRAPYLGLRSVYSGEREYSRILPALGTSLWRELVAELEFALAQVRRRAGSGEPIHVVGWSMGAAFAYIAPLLDDSVGFTLAAGSCARVTDLLAAGETRRHSFFFYPLDGLACFDLEDVVDAVIASGHRLAIVHGDRDLGCLEATTRLLMARARSSDGLLEVEVVPDHGHILSSAIKERIRARLEAAAR